MRAATTALACLLSLGCKGSHGDGSAKVGPETVVATYEQRQQLGFDFGFSDGTLGAVRQGSQVVLFASAKSHARCAGTPQTQGVYRLVADAADPLRVQQTPCSAVLGHTEDGTKPDGSLRGAFDRDYVGGGPALRVKSEDGKQSGILLVYHAEFHWGPKCGNGYPCFYGTLGLAFSPNDGATFRKLGEIVQPTVSRKEWMADHPNDSIAVGYGPIVAGDEAGHPLAPDAANPNKDYLYVFYDDRDPGSSCGEASCLTVARARLHDVLGAAFGGGGGAHAAGEFFRKYHDGRFDEPATSGDPNDGARSGRYTPLVKNAFMPSALFDHYLGKALLAVVRDHAVEIRASASLLDWSAAPIATVDEKPEREIRYPSLVGDTESPAVGGRSPWLFYVDEPPSAGWPRSLCKTRRLQL